MLTTSEIFHDTRILNELDALSEQFEVKILAKKYPGQAANSKLPFKIKLISYRRFQASRWGIFSSFFALMRAAFRENPDIYHAHDLDGLLCCFLPALLKRKTLIYDSHELWSDTYPFGNLQGIQWVLPILEKILIWRVKAGITVNQSIASYLKKKYGKDFLCIYNTTKLEKQAKSELNLREEFPGKKIILHLGAADEGRGLEQMILAAKDFPKNMVLVFVGGGKIEQKIKELAKKANLSNVFMFSAVAPAQIASTIAQADLGLALTEKISLSYYYSLPNKLFQYIAGETPILGSNFPEFKEIILKNKIGEVVDSAKPRLIAKKIKEMTKENKQKLYRKNLQGLAEEKYNWSLEATRLAKFYKSLLD